MRQRARRGGGQAGGDRSPRRPLGREAERRLLGSHPLEQMPPFPSWELGTSAAKSLSDPHTHTPCSGRTKIPHFVTSLSAWTADARGEGMEPGGGGGISGAPPAAASGTFTTTPSPGAAQSPGRPLWRAAVHPVPCGVPHPSLFSSVGFLGFLFPG